MLAALLLLSAGAWAQNRITVDADYFTRGEIRVGGLPVTKGSESIDSYERANFIVERTRVGFDYDGEGLHAKLAAQHSGTWGSQTGGTFNVFEAWIKFSSQKGFFAQAGRQNLAYDDQRIFGSDDWSMTGISHDALKLGYEGHGHKFHIFGGYNQNPENMNGGNYYTGGLQPYKAMEAAWYHYDIPRTNLGISLLFVDIGMQAGEKGEDEKVNRQQMYGTYLKFAPKRWTAEAAYYYQGGTHESGIPLDAWMASTKVSYRPGERFTCLAGYDYLSGDDYFAVPAGGNVGMVRHEVIKGFSSVYGSHHQFYGAMDFFYMSTYRSGFTPGMQNAYAGINWKPGGKADVNMTYHFLAITSNLENLEKPLGQELELSASYPVHKDAKLSIGYSYMIGTETMKALKRTDDNGKLRWAWIMLSVTPRLFSGSVAR